MLSFDALDPLAPDIAGPIRARLVATGLALLGTIRADGSPRVSPIEVSLQRGGLYLGMMPGSWKARDLVRDPRCALLTPVADRDDLAGEGKLFGRVRAITDPAETAAVLRTAVEHLDLDPEELTGSPAFEVLVDGAAWQYVEGDTFVTRSWNARDGVRLRHRVGATGEPVDIG